MWNRQVVSYYMYYQFIYTPVGSHPQLLFNRMGIYLYFLHLDLLTVNEYTSTSKENKNNMIVHVTHMLSTTNSD